MNSKDDRLEDDGRDEFDSMESRIEALKDPEKKSFRLSPEKRADVLALLIGGVSTKNISKETGVSLRTVYVLKKQYEENQYHGAIKDINQKLGSYIAASLKYHLDALNSVAKVANEEDYIRGQSGRELAELHKQLEHWTVSILSATNTISRIAEHHEAIIQIPEKTKK
jgi:hypothetical protein